MTTLHRSPKWGPHLLRRLLVSIIADAAVIGLITNFTGAVAITVIRVPIWVGLWTGFYRPELYGFIPLGLWAGAAGVATTALIFSVVRHRPAATWLQRVVHTLTTYLASLAIVRCCGSASSYLPGYGIKCAYMALVGHVVVGRFRWSLHALDLFNLQVSTACSVGLRRPPCHGFCCFRLPVEYVSDAVCTPCIADIRATLWYSGSPRWRAKWRRRLPRLLPQWSVS